MKNCVNRRNNQQLYILPLRLSITEQSRVQGYDWCCVRGRVVGLITSCHSRPLHATFIMRQTTTLPWARGVSRTSYHQIWRQLRIGICCYGYWFPSNPENITNIYWLFAWSDRPPPLGVSSSWKYCEKVDRSETPRLMNAVNINLLSISYND